MKLYKVLTTIFAFVTTSTVFLHGTSGFADTYQILTLDSDTGRSVYGLDDSGTVVLSNELGCLPTESICYLTFVHGTKSGPTSTPPVLAYDNGTPCIPVIPGAKVFFGQCNGTREAFTGIFGSDQLRPGVYDGPDPIANFVAGPGGTPLVLNANGDIVWDDVFNDEIVEAVDLSSRTPEPGTLMLLGTGMLTLLAHVTRRSSDRKFE